MSEALITDQGALDQLVAALSEVTMLGLDTEFVRVSTFYPKPGLIQIALADRAYLVDPIAGMDIAGLGAVLASGPLSVLHAAQEDYEVLFRLTGQLPAPVFDTQIAYALVAPKISLSLSALAEEVVGQVIAKDETRSDWTKRPLTEAQCRYAKDDVLVLSALYDALSERLDRLGRTTWMREEMERIHTRNQTILSEGDVETQVHKFGNAWRLSPEGMSRLVHLVKWREDTARQLDRPRKQVLSDQSIFSLASSGRAERHHQLVSQHELSDKQADRFGGQLKAVLAEAEEGGSITPPPPPLSKRQKEQLRSLQHQCEEVAKALNIAPEMLVRKRQLVAALDGRGWRPSGWRAEILDGVFTDAIG